MADEGKKISFGFSKLAKKTSIVPSTLNKIKPEEKKIEFIDCLEGQSIKLKDPIKPENKLLVIPIINTSNTTKNNLGSQTNLKDQQVSSDSTEESSKHNHNNESDTKNEDLLTSNNKGLTLDQIAAKEILDEVNKKTVLEERRIFTVPLTTNAPEGENESTIDDYESVPVNEFGLAVLRGMGWAPGKGIGKTEKLVTPSLPPVRPKGMGLGADKYVKPQIEKSISGDVLKMSKGSYIRVIAGTHKDNYGQIEGFDDESGRVIVKLVFQNSTVSLNEFMIQLVDKADFTKNSKVINVGKYEQYKNEEGKSQNIQDKAVKCPEIIDKIKAKKYNKNEYNASDSEGSTKNNKLKKDKRSPHRKSRDTYSKSQSRSTSSSPESRPCKRSRSPKTLTSKLKINDNKMLYKEETRIKKSSKYRHSSSSSLSSSSSDRCRNYSRKNKVDEDGKSKFRTIRSRSRSPRKHSSHSRHKKSSKYR